MGNNIHSWILIAYYADEGMISATFIGRAAIKFSIYFLVDGGSKWSQGLSLMREVVNP